jgi:hypothetical protein
MWFIRRCGGISNCASVGEKMFDNRRAVDKLKTGERDGLKKED